MVKIEWITGFNVEKKLIDNRHIRPTPPQGYIQCSRVGPSGGNCPNCGEPKPGIVWSGGGFKNRDVQNISKAMDRLVYRGVVCQTQALLIDISNEGEDPLCLRDHPSRYSSGEFLCCGAKIWSDFFDDDTAKYSGAGWRYYYEPKICKSVIDIQSGLFKFESKGGHAGKNHN